MQVLSVYTKEENIGEELLSRAHMGKYRSDGYIWHAIIKVRHGGWSLVTARHSVVVVPHYALREQGACAVPGPDCVFQRTRLEFKGWSWVIKPDLPRYFCGAFREWNFAVKLPWKN